jgi:hypothetical protein
VFAGGPLGRSITKNNTAMNTPTSLRTLLGAFFALIFATTAVAANVHLVGDPEISDVGEQLKVCLKLAGLGNKDVTITVAATGTATVTGFNPGGNEPPGQNKVPISTVTSTTLPRTAIKNGTVSACLTTPLLEAPDATDAGFPNDLWTVVIDDVEFTEVTITVVQNGKLVLSQTITL